MGVLLHDSHFVVLQLQDKTYLESINRKECRKKVLDYVEKEDSSRSITYPLELMKKVGFNKTEISHKNMCFGAFGGIK